jgi:hypothetical protein
LPQRLGRLSPAGLLDLRPHRLLHLRLALLRRAVLLLGQVRQCPNPPNDEHDDPEDDLKDVIGVGEDGGEVVQAVRRQRSLFFDPESQIPDLRWGIGRQAFPSPGFAIASRIVVSAWTFFIL